MIVIEKAKAIALNLNNPNRVLESIPESRKLMFNNQQLVVTPHTITASRGLRQLGFKVPSPILHYYDWCGEFTPYEHQKMTSAFLTMHNKALVLNEIGTGKTQSALWACDYLMSVGAIKKVLIISPLSTLERVWGDSIFMGFPHRQAVTLHGTSSRRLKLLKTNADFFIINHDGFSIISEEIKGMFDLIIIDEAAVLRNPSTNRFRVVRKYLKKYPSTRLWMMTGTPTPNDPTDAWALAQLVESPYVNKTYTGFRESVMMKIGQWKWLPRPESINIVKHVLYPAVRYSRDECLDLPDTVFQTRKVALTKEQKDHHDKMLKNYVTELAKEGTITAVNEAVKLQKLVQISCGVVYGDDSQHIELDCSPRVNLVKEVIEEVGGKVIVFVPLTGTLKMLERILSKQWSVGVVNGEVSATKRNEIFYNFQHTKDPHVLVAHPATMAHGLTLTSASTIIWYGPVTSNEQYVQANGRIERIGKKHVSNIIHIEATELEHKMFERLKNKQKLQGLLLDLIKEGTNE
jgi:SNF2 family DNA or RNA helicase